MSKSSLADRELLTPMAQLAAKALEAPFAYAALKGLLSLGFDPMEPLFDGLGADRCGREKINYVMDLAAYGPPGAPMLRALLENGVDPEGGASSGEIAPLMLAIYENNLDAAILLAKAGASWTRPMTDSTIPSYMKDHGEASWEMLWSKQTSLQVWSPKGTWTMTEAGAKSSWLQLATMAARAIKDDEQALARSLGLLGAGLASMRPQDAPASAQAKALGHLSALAMDLPGAGLADALDKIIKKKPQTGPWLADVAARLRAQSERAQMDRDLGEFPAKKKQLRV